MLPSSNASSRSKARRTKSLSRSLWSPWCVALLLQRNCMQCMREVSFVRGGLSAPSSAHCNGARALARCTALQTRMCESMSDRPDFALFVAHTLQNYG
jgi:hypothetical protein